MRPCCIPDHSHYLEILQRGQCPSPPFLAKSTAIGNDKCGNRLIPARTDDRKCESLSSGRMNCGKRLIPDAHGFRFRGMWERLHSYIPRKDARQPSAVPISPVSAPRTTTCASSKGKGVPTSPENGIPPAPFIPLRQITELALNATPSILLFDHFRPIVSSSHLPPPRLHSLSIKFARCI